MKHEERLARRREDRVDEAIDTDLLHDTSLPLRESDVTTRLISDELDLNLSSLTSGLIIIIVVVVRC